MTRMELLPEVAIRLSGPKEQKSNFKVGPKVVEVGGFCESLKEVTKNLSENPDSTVDKIRQSDV